jgi:hypothetical protein
MDATDIVKPAAGPGFFAVAVINRLGENEHAAFQRGSVAT